MPTIIDSLLVTLGLDNKGFKKGKDEVDKGLADSRKKADENFKAMAKSAAGFFAIIGSTYEIKQFIQNQIEANSALDRLSKNLNESANNLSAWGQSAELAGGDAKGLQSTMDMLSRAQTELQLTGQSGLIPYFSALGISLADASGKAKPISDILLDLSERFGHMNRTTANNMGRMMGIDQGTLQLLLKGRSEVELYLKRQKQYNALTNEQAAEASRLREQMVRVHQTFEAFGRQLMQDISPALEKMFELLEDFGEWCQDHKALIEGFFAVIAIVITRSVLPALAALGGRMIAALGPIGLLGAALASLWEDYQVWKEGGNSLFNWGPAVEGATAAFRVLKSVLIDVLYRLAHVGAAIAFLAQGDWSDAAATAQGILTGKPATTSSDDRQKFIDAAAAKLGVPSGAIDAQLRLETGPTGSKTIGNFNYGNIKTGSGYKGAYKEKAVSEYKNGVKFTDMAQFRSYANPEEAAADYASMIARRFPGAVGAKDAGAFARGLQAGGYATDPNYAAKVSAIAVGIPGASGAARGVGSQSRLMSNIMAPNRTVQTTIGEVNVHTQATDADGIAKDMGKSLNFLFAPQANYGLTP